MSRYQKGKTNLDFTEARDSEWQWHQLGHMQVCTSLQADNHVRQHSTTQLFTGRMPFLVPNQQRQSTEGITIRQDNCSNRPHLASAAVRTNKKRRRRRSLTWTARRGLDCQQGTSTTALCREGSETPEHTTGN